MSKTWTKFRAKFDQYMTFHAFSQKTEMQGSSARVFGTDRVEVDLTSIEGGRVDIKEGICINLSRMWVYVRNLPKAISAEDRADVAPELAFLRRNLNTIMCAQALQDARLQHATRSNDAFAVHGLSTHGYRVSKTFFGRSTSDNYYDEMVKNGGCLIILGGRFAGGGHAIAFDTRSGKFDMFDPNYGLIKVNSGAGAIAKQLINYYFSAIEYYPTAIYSYARC